MLDGVDGMKHGAIKIVYLGTNVTDIVNSPLAVTREKLLGVAARASARQQILLTSALALVMEQGHVHPCALPGIFVVTIVSYARVKPYGTCACHVHMKHSQDQLPSARFHSSSYIFQYIF